MKVVRARLPRLAYSQGNVNTPLWSIHTNKKNRSDATSRGNHRLVLNRSNLRSLLPLIVHPSGLPLKRRSSHSCTP